MRAARSPSSLTSASTLIAPRSCSHFVSFFLLTFIYLSVALSHASTMADLVDSMLDLMRRLPPTRTEENVDALIRICPEYVRLCKHCSQRSS